MSGKIYNRRNFINARNLREEAKQKLKDYDAIMGKVKSEYENFRKTGILCKAFTENNDNTSETI